MKALVVLGGGAIPEELLFRELETADAVLAADSGAMRLDALGRLPDVLVGDMDSVGPALLETLEAYGVEIVRANSEKDETDGQLALDLAISRGASEITLLGAAGGRLDHMLGNLMLLVRAAMRGVSAIILDGDCKAFAATGPIEITGKIGDTVSVLPIGEGVSIRYLDGFKYGTPESLPLPVDAPVGVSNVMTADTAHVVVDGWVYFIRFLSLI